MDLRANIELTMVMQLFIFSKNYFVPSLSQFGDQTIETGEADPTEKNQSVRIKMILSDSNETVENLRKMNIEQKKLISYIIKQLSTKSNDEMKIR